MTIWVRVSWWVPREGTSFGKASMGWNFAAQNVATLGSLVFRSFLFSMFGVMSDCYGAFLNDKAREKPLCRTEKICSECAFRIWS